MLIGELAADGDEAEGERVDPPDGLAGHGGVGKSSGKVCP